MFKKLVLAVYPSVPIASLILAVMVGSAHGDFIKVSSNKVTDGSIDATAGGKTLVLNAGAAADLLIVGTSTEFGDGNTFTATYDGNPMIWASGNGSQSNLFYLDLTETTYSGGNANLVFSWNYTAGGDLGVGWISLDAQLQAGESIALHSTGFSGGSQSVDLVTDVDGTFNFVNFNGNKGSGTTIGAPLTKIYANASFGSNAGGAGYEANVGAGTNTYSWNQSASRRIDAAAFAVVVPEPSTVSLAVFALLGLTAFVRRRKR